MDAFSIYVLHSDKLNFYSWGHFEKNELYVGVSGRLVHFSDGVRLESKELAEQYKDAIKARRIKAGDTAFDAEVVEVSSQHPSFSETVLKNSAVVREKLEKWNHPSPENLSINTGGWIIRIEQDDKKHPLYLMTLGKNGSVKLCTDKGTAKIYKLESFVQKALIEVNKIPKLRAFAISVD